MDINILLVVHNEESREKYKIAAQKLGVNVVAVPSFFNLDQAITEKRYHGLLVDLQTKLKAAREDEEFVRNIVDKFPVAALNINKNNQNIKALSYGQQRGGTLEDFINKECRYFAPRRFRYHVRKQIHFNLIVSKGNSFKEGDCERTATIDVSKGGCFIFSIQRWAMGQDIWFIIKELKDNAPIHGQVRHYVPWGSELQLPGIGVEFISIKECQLKEICDDYRL